MSIITKSNANLKMQEGTDRKDLFGNKKRIWNMNKITPNKLENVICGYAIIPQTVDGRKIYRVAGADSLADKRMADLSEISTEEYLGGFDSRESALAYIRERVAVKDRGYIGTPVSLL